MRWWSALSLMLLGAALASCGGDGPTDPAKDGVSEADLTFVRFAANTLPLVTRDTSFWALRGEDRVLVLRYQPEQPGDEGDEFLKFKVPGNSLVRRPDGTTFAEGDSVRIEVHVDDAGRFLFHFEPTGLVFDPDEPAELKVAYREADDDLNGDGDIDDEDVEIKFLLNLWRQDEPGGRWFRLATLKFEDLDEVEAEVFHFSRFGLASN